MKKFIFSFIIAILAIPSISLATEDNDDNGICIDLDEPIPVVSLTSNTNQGITLSWDKIDDNRLAGYKVVISEDNETPVYPANGYLKWITNADTTSQLIDNSSAYHNGDFGSYLNSDEEYYFSITAVYDCGGTRTSIAGNVLKLKFQEGLEDNDDEDSNDNDEDSNDNDEDSNDGYDDDGDNTNDTAYPVPEVNITSSEDGILLSWKKITDDEFTGYKVVVSKFTKNPKYPDHGYARYITNPNTISYLLNNNSNYIRGDFGGYLKTGEDYYFSITALYGNTRIAGNSIEATYAGPSHKTKPTIDPLIDMEEKAEQLLGNNLGGILGELEQLRSMVREQANEIKYLRSLMSDMHNIAQSVQDALNQFITYGVDANTEKLGAGERAAVIHSFKSAFNKLPETEDEMADAIRIANGRWPAQTSEAAENRAKIAFRKIYLRDANMNNPNDNAAVTVMTYGLRQKAENRNLDSEREGIKTFKYVYGYTPASTEDWNIMQAITYSGATR